MPRLIPGAVLALAVVCTANAPASADMGFPGLQRATPTHRITTCEAFPDHVFVIHRPSIVAGKDRAEYVDLEPGKPVVVDIGGSRRDRAAFLIAPRSAAGSYATASKLAEAVRSGRIDGATQYELMNEEDVPEWYGDKLTIDYRVQRVTGDPEGRLEVVRTTWDQGYQCCVVGLACPVGTVLGGVWLIRRFTRRPNPPGAGPPD
jgi:hypothetical protein